MTEKRNSDQHLFQNMLIFFAEIMTVAAVALFLCYMWCWQYTMVGNSMTPVINNEETVLINRAAYFVSVPKRFDAVLLIQGEEQQVTIKRIIGLPGETVQISDGLIYINGSVIDCPYTIDGITNAGMAQEPLLLGEEEYFVLGDNAQFSEDSRSEMFGLVQQEQILGKPWYVLFPMKDMRFIR